MEFEFGNLYVTNDVAERAENDENFMAFINKAFCKRYCKCDWGDICEEDAKQNDEAVQHGERILAVYKYDKDTTIWIITEADRSCTTILFPENY